MRKRFYRVLIALSMTAILFGVSACGNNASDSETVPTETENTTESTTESEEETETESESTEKEEESSKEESQKEETEKSEAESKTESDSKKESESKEESKAEPSTKATETKETKADNSNKTAESTSAPAPTTAPAPVHEHSYTSSVTQNPTCTIQGVRTYVCSCGASYTESIPCTEHTWKEIYGTVEHSSVGEWQQVQVGTSGEVHICNSCGAEFDSASAMTDHRASFVGVDNGHARATSTIRDGQPIYESQYIIIQDAWTENTVVGYQCTICAATK